MQQINTWNLVAKISTLHPLGLHSLAIQEVHNRLQDVVSILSHAAAGTGRHIPSAFHLAQDVSHLLHTVFYVGLKTGGKQKGSTDVLLKKRQDQPSLTWHHAQMFSWQLP